MSSAELYQQLADAYHHQGKFPERDRFLVLAMDAAQESGQVPVAEQVRRRLLELNPNHLIKPYATAAEAVQSPNFANYLGQLRKNFPPAKAQALLREVGKTTSRQPTMLAPEAHFPPADPVSNQNRPPKWSTVEIEVRHKPSPPPTPPLPVFTYSQEPPPVQRQPSVTDPLAHIPPPQPRQAPEPFRLASPPMTTPTLNQQPATRLRSAEVIYSPSGATIGNFFFIAVLLASLATLGYVFVRPLM
jgi:hypothetical protein